MSRGSRSGMIETFSVPSNATDDIEVYRRIFVDLFNLTNITDINSTAYPVTATEWRESVYLNHGAADEFRRHRRQLVLEQTYAIDGKTYAIDELEGLHSSMECGATQFLVTVQLEAIVRDPRARDAFFAVAYGYALTNVLRNFAIVPCDTAFFKNVQLDILPAPSPPPPSDWVIPPSPPVWAYEVVILSTAASGSALFLLMGCLCCAVFGGKSSLRARHTSRFWGTKLERVDLMPYAEREYERRGQEWDGIFKGDARMPTRAVLHEAAAAGVRDNLKALTFVTLLGNRPAATLRPTQKRTRSHDRR